MEKEKITVPILVIGFNRPHCIKKVLEQLSTFQPTNLYFSIDGARFDKTGEIELVNKVKSLVNNLSWAANAHYRFLDHNVGAEVNVSSAISWVLENEECVIVNEDDIYAPYAFYKFEQDMLLRYKDDNRIGMVSGDNFTPYKMRYDYTFGKYGHTWGWGTWKRVWQDFDLNEELSNDVLNIDYLKTVCASYQIAYKTLEALQAQKALGEGKITWDYMFSYYRYKKGYLSIIPAKQLTSNIGLIGLHAKGFTLVHFTEYDTEFVALSHPETVVWDKEYDIFHAKNYLYVSKVRRKIWSLKAKLLAKCKYNNKFLHDFYGVDYVIK